MLRFTLRYAFMECVLKAITVTPGIWVDWGSVVVTDKPTLQSVDVTACNEWAKQQFMGNYEVALRGMWNERGTKTEPLA